MNQNFELLHCLVLVAIFVSLVASGYALKIVNSDLSNNKLTNLTKILLQPFIRFGSSPVCSSLSQALPGGGVLVQRPSGVEGGLNTGKIKYNLLGKQINSSPYHCQLKWKATFLACIL